MDRRDLAGWLDKRPPNGGEPLNVPEIAALFAPAPPDALWWKEQPWRIDDGKEV